MSYSEPSYRFAECARCGAQVPWNLGELDVGCDCEYETFKHLLMSYFSLPEENFTVYATDLYVLYRSDEEKQEIVKFCKGRKVMTKIAYSDVPGNSWFGKHFIEIPSIMMKKIGV